MNKLDVLNIAASISSLQGLGCRCAEIEEKQGKGAAADDDLMDKVIQVLRGVKQIGFTPSHRPADFECRGQAMSAGGYIKEDPNVTTIRNHLTMLGNAILRDVAKFGFLWVEQDLRAFVDSDTLFDGAVSVSACFPTAVPEIREAGNCLATECPTASVFHLMRVAEIGLRVLAFDRDVHVMKNAKTAFEIPLELATWDQMIRELETAENEIQGFPQTLARERQFQFYHGALIQYRSFKNVFRNQIMHARERYDRFQALSAFNSVKSLMQILASEIKEGVRTPKIWTT